MTAPEEQARSAIDALLAAAGWAVQDLKRADLHAARGVALREFELNPGHGTADYLRYVDGKAAGIIDARKQGATLTSVENQSARYARGLPAAPPAGGRITGYLRPGTATFDKEKIDPRLLVDLRLRPDEGGNVEIFRRFWTFAAKDAALVPDPPVYADLMATGDGRCIETADLIFEQIVRADA